MDGRCEGPGGWHAAHKKERHLHLRVSRNFTLPRKHGPWKGPHRFTGHGSSSVTRTDKGQRPGRCRLVEWFNVCIYTMPVRNLVMSTWGLPAWLPLTLISSQKCVAGLPAPSFPEREHGDRRFHVGNGSKYRGPHPRESQASPWENQFSANEDSSMPHSTCPHRYLGALPHLRPSPAGTAFQTH